MKSPCIWLHELADHFVKIHLNAIDVTGGGGDVFDVLTFLAVVVHFKITA